MSTRIIQYRERDPETGEIKSPAIMLCDCGKKLEIWNHHDVHCACGRSYNSSASLLAPRSQWGEETGETAADWDAGVAEGDANRELIDWQNYEGDMPSDPRRTRSQDEERFGTP